MRHIKLTQGKFAIVDDEDFGWLMTWKWHAVRTSAVGLLYAKTSFSEGGGVYMHRLLCVFPHKKVIDHINHEGLDNRKSNLRVVTQRENTANRRVRCAAGVTGVKQKGNRWEAYIRYGDKPIFLGSFSNKEKAGSVYLESLAEIRAGLLPKAREKVRKYKN